MRKPLLLAAALMLITTACRAEANFLVDVAGDGSGEMTVEIGLDEELQQVLEGFGATTEDVFAQFPEGQDVETRVDGDMTFFSASEPFADPADLEDTAGVLEDAGVSFTRLDFVVADGAATLDAVIETPNATEAIEGLGGGGVPGFDIGDDLLSSSLIIGLPGELVSSNADEILTDGRLRWDVPLLGGTVVVQAETQADGGGSSLGLIVGAVAVVLILGAATWIWRRNRQSSVAAVEATAEPDAPKAVFEGRPGSATSGAHDTRDGDGPISG